MPYIARHMEQKVLELSRFFPALLITGPRQAGKTTMLKALAGREGIGRGYVSLDDLNERDMARNDPKLFLQLHRPPVLIDEVQYAPELFTYIKIHVDEQQLPGGFWLTGSQIYRLMRGVQESLAGRVALLHLSPLSQREIAGIPPRPFSVDFEALLQDSRVIPPVSAPQLYERIWKGCMPALASGAQPEREIFYASYLSTYIERDVRELSGGIDALKFNRFVTSAAARCAQLVNFSALAEDADINVQTAKAWLDILETLGLVFLLHPYSNNVLKRTIRTPKLYFYDTGLVCYLTRWSSAEVAEAGAMSGALLENFTISALVKSYQNVGASPYLYFYRDRDAREIDALLEADGKLFPLEIKKTATPDKRLVRNFDMIERSPLERGTGAVLCLAQSFSAFDRENLIVPVWMI